VDCADKINLELVNRHQGMSNAKVETVEEFKLRIAAIIRAKLEQAPAVAVTEAARHEHSGEFGE